MSKTKILTTKQLRQKNLKELHQLLNETQIKKEKNQMAIVNKRSKDTNLLHKDRLLIARIKTILAEKQDLAKLEVANKKIAK